MRNLFLFFFLLSGQMLPAQLIFDFGMGAEAGVFYLSEDRRFYEEDTVRYYGLDLDSVEQFYIKSPRGFKFGFTLMTSCTLTSPDRRFFLTATAHTRIQFASFKTYMPNFVHDPDIPDITWEEREVRPYRALNFSIPVLLNGNYTPGEDEYTVFAGIGLSYNMLKLIQERRVEEVWFVADDRYQPDECDQYTGHYRFRNYFQFETRAGVILPGDGGGQNEFFASGCFGVGKQRSIQLGYTRRFSLYND